MKISLHKTVCEYTNETLMQVVVHDLTEAQIDAAFSILEEEMCSMFAPIPVCGGDVDRENGIASLVVGVGTTVVIDHGIVICQISLRPDDPEDALDMLALPFTNKFVKRMAMAPEF